MRDPDRLDSFYDEVKKIHKRYFPDWRFGQFITNFVEWFRLQTGRDIFYLEDDDSTIQYFREFAIAMKRGELRL